MTFEEILNQALAMLQRQGRVSYRALKRQFDLEDAYIADLKFEIIEVHRTAVDQDNIMLVWMGDQTSAPLPTSAPASPQEREPLPYTPPLLAEAYGTMGQPEAGLTVLTEALTLVDNTGERW